MKYSAGRGAGEGGGEGCTGGREGIAGWGGDVRTALERDKERKESGEREGNAGWMCFCALNGHVQIIQRRKVESFLRVLLQNLH